MRTLIILGIISFGVPASAGVMSFDNGDFSIAVPSNATGGGWTSADIDFAGGHFATGGNPDGHFILNNNGSNVLDPTIQQTVTGLSIGTEYEVSWDYAAHVVGSSFAPSFGVFLDTQTNANAIFIGENLTTNYVSEATTFFATATSHTFIFAGELDTRTNGAGFSTDVSYRLDNVSIAATGASSVPEPSAFALMLLACGCGVFAAKRRRQRLSQATSLR